LTEGVFGRVLVVQHAQAGSENKRAMPPDEGGERGLVTMDDEAFEQL